MGDTTYTESFEKFWKVYPRKVAKPTASKSWLKSIEGDAFLPKQIVADIEKRTRLRWWSKDKTKIPHPSTWLNQRRWEDEGWQDEISPEDSPVTQHVPYVNTDPDFPIWHKEGNKALFRYIRAANGLSEANLKKAIVIKNAAVSEISAALDEDRSAGAEFGECVWAIMDLIVSRLDIDLGLSLKGKVMRG
jgi:hypothetical protein